MSIERSCYALTPARRRIAARPSTPTIMSRPVPGSGTTATYFGSLTVMKLWFTSVPSRFARPMVPESWFA